MRDFTKEECMELLEMSRAVNMKRWEAAVAKGNTYRIRGNGQRAAEQIEDIANLLAGARDQWATAKVKECGIENGRANINLETGKLTPLDNETRTSEAPAGEQPGDKPVPRVRAKRVPKAQGHIERAADSATG